MFNRRGFFALLAGAAAAAAIQKSQVFKTAYPPIPGTLKMGYAVVERGLETIVGALGAIDGEKLPDAPNCDRLSGWINRIGYPIGYGAQGTN